MSNHEDSPIPSPDFPVEAEAEIEVSVSGIIFGPYRRDKIEECLQEGLITSRDPARLTNSDQWQPLAQILGLEVPELPAAEPEFSSPSWPTDASSADEKTESEGSSLLSPEAESIPKESAPPELPRASRNAPSRPLTGPLIRARAATATSTTPLLAVTPPPPGTQPLTGLRSQILAHVAQTGQKSGPLPAPPRPPASGPVKLGSTISFKFAPIRRTELLPLGEPTLPPAVALPGPEPSQVPATTVLNKPAWINEPKIESGVVASTEPASKIPEDIADPPIAAESGDTETSVISFAAKNTFTNPTTEKSGTGSMRRHALPTSRTGSVPVLPVFTITAPAERPVQEETVNFVETAETERLVTPALTAENRPVADADSVIAIKLPEKRTQKIKVRPLFPIRAATVGDLTASEAPPGTSSMPPLPAASSASTAPLPAPARSPALKKNAGVTLASMAAPPPSEKTESPDARRGMANASALAATTVMPGVGAENPPPSSSPNPVTGASALATRSGFGPPQPLAPSGVEEEVPATRNANVVETRRAALKLARQRRRRQGIIYAVGGALFFVLLCFGIYHYTTYTIEAPLPVAPEKEAPPAHAPAKTEATPKPSAAPPATATPASASTNTGSISNGAGAQVTAATNPLTTLKADPAVLSHLTQGQAAQAKGDYDGAIAEFTQAITLDAKYSPSYGYRASARLAKGDTAGALADDGQLLTLDPNNAAGFCQRGFVKQATKDNDGALADYTRAVQLDPKSYVAFYNRGMIQEQTGHPEEAIADYNQALTLNPKLAGAFFNRANAKIEKTDLDGAIADYTRALELDPKIALAYCNRGLAEQNSGNLNAALDDFNRGLAIDPKVGMAYYNRGLIEEQRDDLEGCIRDSTTALQLNTDNVQAYYNRGVAFQAKGNLEAAAAGPGKVWRDGAEECLRRLRPPVSMGDHEPAKSKDPRQPGTQQCGGFHLERGASAAAFQNRRFSSRPDQ